MDPTRANLLEGEVEVKDERATKRNMGTEKNQINHEKERVLMKLEEVVNFLKCTQISNEECFVNIQRPLDDLLSSLKYLPFDKHFDNLPTEIKTNILGYCDMCDNEAFVAASVCQDWRDILKGRLESLEEVRIGECDCRSNRLQCYNGICADPVEMLKASTIHKLDIPLSISHPVTLTEVDPNLITQALTGVSDISIYEYSDSVMTPQQLLHLFAGLQNKEEIMDSVTFIYVELAHLDQDKLVNYFLNKTKKLSLSCGLEDHKKVDGEKLIRKLNNSTDIKLEHLSLGYLDFPDELSTDLADGLCKIKIVDLEDDILFSSEMLNRLVENILTRSIVMKCVNMEALLDWDNSLINPEYFKNLIENMEVITLRGSFSSELMEVAQSIHGVEVSEVDTDIYIISK